MEEKKIKQYFVKEREAHDKISERYLDINSCGVHKESYLQTVRPNGRLDYQLLYVEQGALIVSKGEKEITLTPGGFVLYGPNEPQSYYQKNGVFYWVHFTGIHAEEILSDAQLKEIRTFQGKSHEPMITRCFEKLIFHFARNASLRNLSLCSDLIAILSELGGMVQASVSAKSICDERLIPVVSQMHRDYAKTIELDSYATTVGISRDRFLHLFKEVMGVSPYAYILELRLARGAELLLTSTEPISAVAFAVGFSDPLYFSRLFKKKYAFSPEKFRGNA